MEKLIEAGLITGDENFLLLDFNYGNKKNVNKTKAIFYNIFFYIKQSFCLFIKHTLMLSKSVIGLFGSLINKSFYFLVSINLIIALYMFSLLQNTFSFFAYNIVILNFFFTDCVFGILFMINLFFRFILSVNGTIMDFFYPWCESWISL